MIEYYCPDDDTLMEYAGSVARQDMYKCPQCGVKIFEWILKDKK